jgi:hypothetical protein
MLWFQNRSRSCHGLESFRRGNRCAVEIDPASVTAYAVDSGRSDTEVERVSITKEPSSLVGLINVYTLIDVFMGHPQGDHQL